MKALNLTKEEAESYDIDSYQEKEGDKEGEEPKEGD